MLTGFKSRWIIPWWKGAKKPITVLKYCFLIRKAIPVRGRMEVCLLRPCWARLVSLCDVSHLSCQWPCHSLPAHLPAIRSNPEASLWHQAPFPRFTMIVPLYHKTLLRLVSYWLHSSSRSFAHMKFVSHLVNSLFPSLIKCQFLHQVSQSEITPWHYVPSIHSAQ